MLLTEISEWRTPEHQEVVCCMHVDVVAIGMVDQTKPVKTPF